MTVTTEVEWDEETRSLALALADVDLCPLCHRPTEICQAADAEFEADLPIRCHAYTALLIAQDQVSEDTPQSQALLWSVHERGEVTDG